MTKLNVKKRNETETGKQYNKRLRSSGEVPANIFGLKKESVSIAVNPIELTKIITNSKLQKNQVLTLVFDEKNEENVLISDVDINLINNQIRHVDFVRVDEKQPVSINVPIKSTGTAVGQKLGGVLVNAKGTVLISCLPSDIPVFIEVDITDLNIGENIRASNLSLDSKLTLVSDPYDVLIKIESTKVSKSFDSEDLDDDATESDEAEGSAEASGGDSDESADDANSDS